LIPLLDNLNDEYCYQAAKLWVYEEIGKLLGKAGNTGKKQEAIIRICMENG